MPLWMLALLLALLLPSCDAGDGDGCPSNKPKTRSPCSTLGQTCRYPVNNPTCCPSGDGGLHTVCSCYLYKGEKRWSCDAPTCQICKDGSVATLRPGQLH